MAARDAEGGGAIFTLTLPAEGVEPPAVQEFVSLRASLVSRSGKLFENRRRYLVSSAGIERKRSPSIAKVTSEQLRGGAPVLRTQCGVCSDDCRNGVR